MREVIVSPPRTIMEVFKILPEGTLAEVVDNALYMSPSPTPFHQEVLLDLSSVMLQFVKKKNLGKVYCSPLDVYLHEETNAVQPDIIFINTKNNKVKITENGILGPPDLIVEILSPGNKKHDQVTKKNLYERFGVQEYWIIDPETKIATGYTLTDSAYKLIAEGKENVPSILLNNQFSF